MIDFTELSEDGEQWEAFARDFLDVLGFAIETPPDRGADQGKDLLVVEHLQGRLGAYPFRWLVSCKHLAKSGKAVSESHEPNILERVEAFKANGFMGFYSTLPSAGLNTRLIALRDAGKVRDYRIFDGKLIENYCLRIGYSRLLMRYLPQSYRRVAPLHPLAEKYEPLECCHCQQDLLQELYVSTHPAILGIVSELRGEKKHVLDVWWAHKGACDRALSQAHDRASSWMDIGDLAIPFWYLRWVLAIINRQENGTLSFESAAFDKLKTFLVAMGQKVLREMNEKELERVERLLEIPLL